MTMSPIIVTYGPKEAEEGGITRRRVHKDECGGAAAESELVQVAFQ
jgi:hypothetical protein